MQEVEGTGAPLSARRRSPARRLSPSKMGCWAVPPRAAEARLQTWYTKHRKGLFAFPDQEALSPDKKLSDWTLRKPVVASVTLDGDYTAVCIEDAKQTVPRVQHNW